MSDEYTDFVFCIASGENGKRPGSGTTVLFARAYQQQKYRHAKERVCSVPGKAVNGGETCYENFT
jgi:hypothetical protein